MRKEDFKVVSQAKSSGELTKRHSRSRRATMNSCRQVDMEISATHLEADIMEKLVQYGVIRPGENIKEVEIGDIYIPFKLTLEKEVKGKQINGA